MRYATARERLEAELSDDGKPHVLQLVCEGDEREPIVDTLRRRPQVRPAAPASSPVRASARRPTRSWAYAEKPCAPPPSPPAASDYDLLHRPQ